AAISATIAASISTRALVMSDNKSSGECAAAARALACGAAVAMIRDHDRIVRKVTADQLAQMRLRATLVGERQAQHLIEVAVVDESAPVDAHQAAAHHGFEICG